MEVWVIWPVDQEEDRLFETDDAAKNALTEMADKLRGQSNVDTLKMSEDGRKLFLSYLPTRGSKAFSKRCYQVRQISVGAAEKPPT